MLPLWEKLKETVDQSMYFNTIHNFLKKIYSNIYFLLGRIFSNFQRRFGTE